MINDYVLKITGSASLGQEVEPDKQVKVMMELEVDSVTKKDNKDGSYDIEYKAHISSHIDLQQGERVWRGKDTKSMSKRLRGAIWHLQNNEGIDQDQEQFYEYMMKGITLYLDDIYKFLKTKNV